MAAKKSSAKPSASKPQGWDDVGRGINMAGKVVYEVSGAGDAVRFAKNPSLKNAAMLGLSVAAYAAGPAAKAAQSAKAIKAAEAINATSKVRAAQAVANATKTEKVVKATKGAGTLTTKGGTKVPVSGIKTFSTAKNPASVAAGAKGSVRAAANKAGDTAFKAAESRVTKSKIAAASLASAKAGSTVSTEKQKNKVKPKK